MAVVNIRNRVRKLEAQSSSDLVVLSRHHTETDEQAKARWQAENPGKDLERAGLVVILTEWAA
jgi:hypothetical protein